VTNFVLVPGAGGRSWYWHRVVPLLRSRGHRAVAVDLPADDDSAGPRDYAEAVVAAAAPLVKGTGGSTEGVGGSTGAADGGPLVVVAQSMGGLVAPLVCDRLPVRLLVLVNAMIPMPGETGGAYWANTGQPAAQRSAAERAGRLSPGDPDEDGITVFLHDLPEEVRAQAMADPPTQSGTPFGEPWPLAAWPDVPVRAVVGRDDRLFPPAYQRRVLAERLGVVPDEIPGGHLLALACPQALADLLETYSDRRSAT
jgi:pimeloyl-ACP methyl ester carboxylesterase